MLQPSELLDAARLLVSSHAGPPTDAHLRRCVSTAYYAVFHAVLIAGADRFFGHADRQSAGYALLYRAFDHGRMRRTCEDVGKPALASAQQKQLGRTAFHSALQAFSRSFTRLQSARHRADYDPHAELTMVEAQGAIDEAERAIASLAAAPDVERSDFLALMLGGGRS